MERQYRKYGELREGRFRVPTNPIPYSNPHNQSFAEVELAQGRTSVLEYVCVAKS